MKSIKEHAAEIAAAVAASACEPAFLTVSQECAKRIEKGDVAASNWGTLEYEVSVAMATLLVAQHKRLEALSPKRMRVQAFQEWVGDQAPEAPDDFWVDSATGEYVDALTCERMPKAEALRRISGTSTGVQS